MMKNIEIKVKPFSGNLHRKDTVVELATYDVKSHLNLYVFDRSACGGKSTNVCMNYKDGLELATKLAIAYGLIPDETIVMREVVVDSDGNFLRFPN